jgi:hypothetical protein
LAKQRKKRPSGEDKQKTTRNPALNAAGQKTAIPQNSWFFHERKRLCFLVGMGYNTYSNTPPRPKGGGKHKNYPAASRRAIGDWKGGGADELRA